jgi:hypothetical protein
MSVVALFTWMVTILAGLVLLIIWIIEYDSEFQTAAATRLPVPVISAHALLGLGGLMLWIGYLLLNQKRLAWAAVAALGTVAVLGLIMAARWIGVYRTVGNPGPSLTRDAIVPPERNFPVTVVLLHGILAVTTLVLVLFTAIGPVRRRRALAESLRGRLAMARMTSEAMPGRDQSSFGSMVAADFTASPDGC